MKLITEWCELVSTSNRKKYARPKNTKPKRFNTKKLKSEDTKASFIHSLNYTYNDQKSIEENWEDIKYTYVKAAEDTLGKEKVVRWDWFDDCNNQIDEALKKKKDLHLKRLNQPSAFNEREYKEARRRCQQEIRKIKEDWWKEKTEELQTYMNTNDTHNLYKGINSIVGPLKKPLNVVHDKNGNNIQGKENQLVRWKEYFSELYNQDNPIDQNQPDFNFNECEPPKDEPPSKEEIVMALKNLKNHKSPGQEPSQQKC